MNSEVFVEALIEVVRAAVIEDTNEDLIDPPGRNPSKEDVDLSEWFKKLSEEDSHRLNIIIRNVVDSTVFGVLAVMDGVRAIEYQDKGDFELYHVKGKERKLLNDIKDEYLHDIYKRLTVME